MTIPVFIGCAPNHEDAESQAVLEYTLRKHATEAVDITWMKLTNDLASEFPTSEFRAQLWDTSTWPTPFSGFRYAVPALRGFEGRAIYMDSDVIVLADIAELFNADMHGAPVMAKNGSRLCVSLWDCQHYSVRALTLDGVRRGVRASIAIQPFPDGANWNCLDGEKYASLEDPEIKALHYTSMPHQPHLTHAIPRLAAEGRKHWFDGQVTDHWRPDVTELFDRMLNEASAAGYTVDQYCTDPPDVQYRKGSVASLRGAVPSWGK